MNCQTTGSGSVATGGMVAVVVTSTGDATSTARIATCSEREQAARVRMRAVAFRMVLRFTVCLLAGK